MSTNQKFPGAVIQYTNSSGSKIPSGQIVNINGGYMGVALVDIADGATGSVALEGVFSIPKVSGTSFTIGGQAAIHSATTTALRSTAGGTLVVNGRVHAAAGTASSTVDFKLIG